MPATRSSSPGRRKRASASQKITPFNVYWFYPNLIGYSRIILAIIAFSVAYTDYQTFFVCYFVSAWLDAFDGHVARLYNQTSRFGAVLDMITDRCSTACLTVILAMFFPKYTPAFLGLIALDFCSHYTHMYSTLLLNKSSHKSIGENQNAFLRLYYHNRLFLGFMCAGNEGFFLGLYMVHFNHGTILNIPSYGPVGFFVLFTALCAPIMFVKQIVNVIQWHGACQEIAEFDADQANKTK